MSEYEDTGAKFTGGVFQHKPCEHLQAYPVIIGRCPVCAEIKAAEDKRGEGVLELAKEHILARHGSFSVLWQQIDQAYKEKFGS